jgi:dolichyl-diphosphooligosaccharide--protein glycosyltransferase
MQFVAVWIKRYVLSNWSLNDVCCYIPAWFGVIASFVTGIIAYECSIGNNTHSNLLLFIMDIVNGKKTERIDSEDRKNWSPALESFLISMGMMAIVPAHLMRSVGGGYDNESVAVTAMVMTFYFWVRSLRNGDTYSYLWSFVTALSYFFMVASWGGYVFVLNMIG